MALFSAIAVERGRLRAASAFSKKMQLCVIGDRGRTGKKGRHSAVLMPSLSDYDNLIEKIWLPSMAPHRRCPPRSGTKMAKQSQSIRNITATYNGIHLLVHKRL